MRSIHGLDLSFKIICNSNIMHNVTSCLERSKFNGPLVWPSRACFSLIFQNDGSQACGVYDTSMPQRCRPDSGHDVCCQCLEDVFSGSLILPCSHRIHMDCIVGMIPNWQLTCPICGRPFLWRG